MKNYAVMHIFADAKYNLEKMKKTFRSNSIIPGDITIVLLLSLVSCRTNLP